MRGIFFHLIQFLIIIDIPEFKVKSIIHFKLSLIKLIDLRASARGYLIEFLLIC